MLEPLSALLEYLEAYCPSCTGIIEAILREHGTGSYINLGFLTFHPFCAICHFFRELSQSACGDSEIAKVEAQSWRKLTHFLLYATTAGRRASEDSDIGILFIVYSNSDEQGLFDPKPDIHIRLRRVQSGLPPRPWLWGRPKYPNPLPAIKQWLTACARHNHVGDWLQQISRRRSGQSQPSNIHLVDCEARCVVKKQFDTGVVYAALSYVWGNVDQFTLCSSSYAALRQKGSLSTEKQTLPQSIRDAIDLCHALGIRHLWVDSLCIIQDNEEDKVLHVNCMDMIYQQASLTIVSAAGKDANAGLPAFRHETLKLNRSVSVRGLHLYEWKNIWNMLSPSRPTWLTRGWTFQEAQLSARLLIFTEDTVFCTCSAETVFHDSLSSKLVNSDCMDLSFTPPTLTFHEPATKMSDSPYHTFIEVLKEYVQRQLSIDKDNINALMGILKTLEPTIGPYWHGVPLNAFQSCLHYSSHGSPLVRVSQFPSWSWAGWQLNRGDMTVKLVQSSAPFYRFTQTGDIERLPCQRLGWQCDESTNKFAMPDPTPEELAELRGFEEPNVLRNHLLVFWAWELQVYIAKIPGKRLDYEVLPSADRNFENTIGQIQIEERWLLQKGVEQSLVVFAVVDSGLVQPMLIERVGRIAFRANFVTPRSYLQIEEWFQLKPERKLVILA
jgi:hypothetical protein